MFFFRRWTFLASKDGLYLLRRPYKNATSSVFFVTEGEWGLGGWSAVHDPLIERTHSEIHDIQF
jgi:hypothetical protein